MNVGTRALVSALLAWVVLGGGVAPAHGQPPEGPSTEAGALDTKKARRRAKRSPVRPSPPPSAAPPEKAPEPAKKAPVSASVSDTSIFEGTPALAGDLLPELSDSTPPSKIAITSFVVEGDEAPAALRYQLQDGFVLGLVRAGVRVIDPEDLKSRLDDEPELLGCDSSPCLKQLGQIVGVRHVVRVVVVVTGNSYRMTARVFRTTGAAPAALPVETQSRFCDVCTVTEAREAMLRLADGVRVPDEPRLLDPDRPTPPLQAPSSKRLGLSALVAGVASIALGTVILSASGGSDKGLHALGGAFMGAGALGSVSGLYLYGEALRRRPVLGPTPSAP